MSSKASGRIRPFERTRVLDRRTERLPTAWLGRDRAIDFTSFAKSPLIEGTDTRIEVPPSSEVIFVLIGDHSAALEASVFVRVPATARVYVLAHPRWGEGKGSVLDSTMRKKILLRRLKASFPVSGMLASGASAIWVGSHAARKGSWRVPLDEEQQRAFHALFSHLFWHHAVDEAWTGSAFRPCAAGPFDVQRPPSDAAMTLIDGQPDVGDGDLIYWPDGSAVRGAPLRAWIPASGADHSVLEGLHAGGSEIVWGELGLPPCRAGDERGELLPRSSHWSLRVSLNAQQRAALVALLLAEPAWRFDVGRSLDAIADDHLVWLPGSPQAEPLIAQASLHAPAVVADALAKCATSEPSSWPSPSPLALSALWRWSVSVPTAPNGATEDVLLSEWKKVDDDVARRLDAGRRKLDELERHEERLGRTFVKLAGALLGFGTSRDQLLQRLQSIDTPSRVGPESSIALLESLSELEDGIARLARGLDDEERKAIEDRAREQQQSEYAAHRQRLAQDLERKQGEADQAAAHAAELHEAEANEDAALTEQDRKARKQKLSDERHKSSKHLEYLTKQVNELKKQLEEPFEFKPPSSTPSGGRSGKKGGPAFVPESPAGRTTTIPRERLPKVGKLMAAAKQRYLVIRFWEELAAGEVEAARLNARLVAEREDK